MKTIFKLIVLTLVLQTPIIVSAQLSTTSSVESQGAVVPSDGSSIFYESTLECFFRLLYHVK
jgi:hypothetical protein